MDEFWIDIPDYEGLYQVSSLGRVKSLKRVVEYIDGRKYTYPERILKHRLDGCGYPYVNLHKDKKPKSMKIHKLMHLAFKIGDVNLHIDHIDRDRTNNRLENLRAVTQRQNLQNMNKKSNLPAGVSFHKQTGKYQAHIKIECKLKHLGLFTCPNKASQAYQSKLNKLNLVFVDDM